MKLDSQPHGALRPFVDLPHEPAALTWSAVADQLDSHMAQVWAQPCFDDGWDDTRWLCDDERFVEERLSEAEALLSRVGAPVDEPAPRRGAELRLGGPEVPQLVHAARGLRWVRGVVTDGLRWGLLMGRLRWIAATHPAVSRSALPQVLAADYQPLGSGWGFEELLRREDKQKLAAALPHIATSELASWLTRAIDAFDNPELARLLEGRATEIANIDPTTLGSRRARGRIRKLGAMIGVDVREPAASAATPHASSAAEPEPQAPAESFASIRASLLERVGGNRALFISNREDPLLRDKLSSTFGLALEWCVANPRRVDAATDSIRRGRYQVILSATGFQDHTMDAAFSRAARDSSTLYVRVNRGRPAACARAIARELGVRPE